MDGSAYPSSPSLSSPSPSMSSPRLPRSALVDAMSSPRTAGGYFAPPSSSFGVALSTPLPAHSVPHLELTRSASGPSATLRAVAHDVIMQINRDIMVTQETIDDVRDELMNFKRALAAISSVVRTTRQCRVPCTDSAVGDGHSVWGVSVVMCCRVDAVVDGGREERCILHPLRGTAGAITG